MKTIGDRIQVQRVRQGANGQREIIIPTGIAERISNEEPYHLYEILQLGTGPMFQKSNPKNLLKHLRVGWTVVSNNCAGLSLPDSSRLISVFDVLAVYPLCAVCGAPATCYGNYEMTAEDYACDQCCAHGNEDGWCKPTEEFVVF